VDEARALLLAAAASMVGMALILGLAFAVATLKWKGIIRRADRLARAFDLTRLNRPRMPIGQWYGGSWKGRPFVATYVNMRIGAGRGSSVISGLHLAMAARVGGEIGSLLKRTRGLSRRKSHTFTDLYRASRPEALSDAGREALQAFAWEFDRADLSLRPRARVPRGWLLPGVLEDGRSVLFVQRWRREVPTERAGEMLDAMGAIVGALEEASTALRAGDEVAAARRRAQVAELGTVGCRGCGASLPVEAGTTATRCLFCGESAQLPSALVADLEALPRAAARVEDEGRQAYAAAVADARVSSPLGSMVIGVVFVFVLVGLIMGPIFLVRGLAAPIGIDPGTAMAVGGVIAALLGVGGLFGLVAAIIGVTRWRRQRTIRGVLARADERAGTSAPCPQCQAPVKIPPRAATLLCASCGSPLLASHGLLIVWAADAAQRADEWRTSAARVLDADAIADFERTPRAVFIGLMGTMVLFSAGLAVVGIAVTLFGG
jgi:hypothetical protein